MFVGANSYEGLPPRLYRSPREIKADISRISKEIQEADEMISIRHILMEMISECAVREPKRWLSELEEAVYEAREGLERLERLKLALEELEDELREAKCYLEA